MNTIDVEWRILEYKRLYAIGDLTKPKDMRSACKVIPLLKNDFEELGAAIIHNEEVDMRRHYVNLMCEIFTLLARK